MIICCVVCGNDGWRVFVQVSKRSLLRQLMGTSASSSDALAQVCHPKHLFPLLTGKMFHRSCDQSRDFDVTMQRGAACLKGFPDAVRNMLVTS
jgi:hypothetical protein